MKHDIFISYRRDGGFETAHYLYEKLEKDGYRVTFDIDALRNGRFDDALLARIDECTDFIVVLNRGCFNRCLDPGFPPDNDWLRRELARALQKRKNVIPILLAGFTDFPPDLPEDIDAVRFMNGPKYVPQYIDEFYRTLKERFLLSPAPRNGGNGGKRPRRGRVAAGILLAAALAAGAALWQRNGGIAALSGNADGRAEPAGWLSAGPEDNPGGNAAALGQNDDEAEEESYRLRLLAETRKANEEGMGHDRGQGFGEALDGMVQNFRLGQIAMEAGNFAKSKKYFEASLSMAGWMETNAPLRTAAAAAREKATAAKEKADILEGAHLGLRAYRQGETKRNAAEKAFADARFPEAEAGWNAAAAAYGESESAACAAKTEMGLVAARGAEKRKDWKALLASADAVLALSPDNPEALALKDAAKKQIAAAGHEPRDQAQTQEKSPGPDQVSAKASTTAAALGRGTRAGEEITIALPGGATMNMVWCPPGSFMMGSTAAELNAFGVAFDDETRHKVTLTEGFWMAKTEVTQAQWESVMGNNPSRNKGDDLPVDSVSWEDCQAFCEKAGLRLPTDSQWEYACRAGSTGAFAGTGNPEDMAWHYANSGGKPHPVGLKRPNAWGLHDMHGNVWEWCADWDPGDWGPIPRLDPVGKEAESKRYFVNGAVRSSRGGSWLDDAVACRSADRGGGGPANKYTDFRQIMGFRPAATP